MNTEFYNYRKNTSLFLFSQTASLFGSSIVQYAIVWYITLTVSSGTMITFSVLCGFLPQILISFCAGVWIDRYDKKKLIMISDSVIAAATLMQALLFFMGYDEIWQLLLLLFIRSAATGVQMPAVNSIIPQIAHKESLMRVNSLNSSISSFMMVVSPVLSGLILSFYSIKATFMIDVATAIIGVGIMSTVKVQPHIAVAIHGESFIDDLKGGISYIRENIFIKRLIIYQFIILFMATPSAFLTPLMVSRSFGKEVWLLAASEMTYGGGALIGGLLLALWGGLKDRIKMIVLAGLAYGIFMISLGLSTTFIVYLVFNFMIGVTLPYYSASITVLIQERADPAKHGRVFSFLQIASSSAFPLGMLVFGPLADIFRVEALLICSGVCFVAYVILSRIFKYFEISPQVGKSL